MSQTNEQSYVFISYAHANSDKVLPTIGALKHNGIQLWYDSGIVAGSEWPEFIAERVLNCRKFVLFVSNAYLNSQNCKRELNFAISRKKEILSIYLEDVSLTPGMEMQLGSYQAIFRNRFPSDETFFTSLCKEPFFTDCRDGSAAPKQTTYTPPVNQAQYTATPQPKPVQNQYAAPTPQPKPVQNQYNPQTYTPPQKAAPAKPAVRKNKFVAFLLAFFLGSFGAHYFYLGQTGKGILSLIFCWSYIPGFIAFFVAFKYLLMPDAQFQEKCVEQK